MKIIERPLIHLAFVSAVLILSAVVVNAQGTADYKFLEVIDFAGHPVANATVTGLGSHDCNIEKKTNQKGQLEPGLVVCSGDSTTTGFTVAKPGYYPFTDILESFRLQSPIRLELLLIPRTPAEVKAVGNEELKREFFAAAKEGNAQTVRKFLSQGQSPNLTTTDLRGVPGVKDVPIILFAARSGDAETVRTFLSAGVNVRQRLGPVCSILAVYLSASPFHRFPNNEEERRETFTAFENGAENLIAAGADLNVPNWDADAYFFSAPPLMVAAEGGYLRSAQLLIEKGALLNGKDNYQRTVLMRAIDAASRKEFRLEMVRLLLEAGADPNIIATGTYQSRQCDTALKTAINARNPDVVKLLLEHKADVNLICDMYDELPLTFAKRLTSYDDGGKLQRVIKLFEAAGAKENNYSQE